MQAKALTERRFDQWYVNKNQNNGLKFETKLGQLRL